MQKISYHFSIEPNWDIEEYKALDYKLDKHKDEDDNQRYISAGHLEESLQLYNYFEPNPMPDSIEYMKLKGDGIDEVINVSKTRDPAEWGWFYGAGTGGLDR